MWLWCCRRYCIASKFAAVKWPMSRLTLKYFESFIPSAKLSGEASGEGRVFGTPSDGREWILDGAVVTDRRWAGDPMTQPALDSIQEFTVQANAISAKLSRPVSLAVQGDDHLVLLRKRRNPLRYVERRRRCDDLGAERPGHVETAVNLRVAEGRVRAVVVGVDRDAGLAEPSVHVAEVVEGGLEPPGAERLARASRLDVRREQFDVAEAALDHRGDDSIHGVRSSGRARYRAKTVGLHADADAGDA